MKQKYKTKKCVFIALLSQDKSFINIQQAERVNFACQWTCQFMASWSRSLVSFESLQSCLSPPKWFTSATHVRTCRKNGRSKCMKFHGRITFSWRCSVFRPDSRRICSGTRAPGKFFSNTSHVSRPSDGKTTRSVHVASELCKTISTISTHACLVDFIFHAQIADSFQSSFRRAASFFLATWWRSFKLFTTTILCLFKRGGSS